MIRRWLLIFVLLATSILPLLPADQAEAFAGRAEYHGYFSNIRDTNGGGCRGGRSAGDVLCDGLYPGGGQPQEDFLQQINDDLSYAGGWGSHNQTGAAFIILTMMGVPPPNPGNRNALVTQAANMWPQFEAAVRYYHSQGWVLWNTWASGNVQNTYWQGGPGPDDIAWYDNVVASEAILFFNPNTGANYFIRKECGNPLGAMNPLVMPPVDYNVGLTATGLTIPNGAELPVSGSGTAADPYKVIANHKYGVNAVVSNAGPANSAAGLLQVIKPGAVCAPSGACPLYVSNTHSGGTSVSGEGYQPVWPGWYWNTNPMPPGEYISAFMNFTPTGAVGTVFTLDVYYAPADLGGAQRHVALTYLIVSQRTPNVGASNGDIHAGGGLCGGVLTDGTVKGYPGAGSGGQYVVSASVLGGINGVASNGTGADTLRLGSNGGYAKICRPDLVKAATSYQLVGGYTSISGSVDVATLNPAYEVYYSTGGVLRLHGTVNRKITIVALSGTVEIDGNITRSNATFAKNAQPSLGIIAAGDILVHAPVSQVDAYLFSNGTIDTCVEANIACANTGLLTINGFVMSRSLSLHRLGQRDTNGQVAAERINLTPQIYLNPPKLFDASVDDILLNGLGEKQPLF